LRTIKRAIAEFRREGHATPVKGLDSIFLFSKLQMALGLKGTQMRRRARPPDRVLQMIGLLFRKHFTSVTFAVKCGRATSANNSGADCMFRCLLYYGSPPLNVDEQISAIGFAIYQVTFY